MKINRQLEEILSWRFVTEMHRRFPQTFSIIEAHPCSGQYDCLVLVKKERPLGFAIDINRGGGSVHIHKSAFGINDDIILFSDWADKMLTSPKKFLSEISDESRLNVPKKVPSSIPETIVYRFISDFLTHSIGRLDKWECRNGYLDTSGYGGGRRDHLFEKFPTLDSGEIKRSDEHTIYNFWFLIKNNNPVLCLNTCGVAHCINGKTHDLKKLYMDNRRIWPLIIQVASEHLP